MLVVNYSLREWFLQFSVSTRNSRKIPARNFPSLADWGFPKTIDKLRHSTAVSVSNPPRSKLNRQRTFYRKRRGPRDHKHRGSAYGVSLATIICLLTFSSDIPLRCNVVYILAAMKLITITFPYYRFVSFSLSLSLSLSWSVCTCTHAHTHVQTHKGVVRFW